MMVTGSYNNHGNHCEPVANKLTSFNLAHQIWWVSQININEITIYDSQKIVLIKIF